MENFGDANFNPMNFPMSHQFPTIPYPPFVPFAFNPQTMGTSKFNPGQTGVAPPGQIENKKSLSNPNISGQRQQHPPIVRKPFLLFVGF